MKAVKELYLVLSALRLTVHLIILGTLKDKEPIHSDIEAWSRIYYKASLVHKWHFYRYFIMLMTFRPAYRNLYYYRIRKERPLAYFLLKPFCPPLGTLYITTEKIGKALILQHAFSTIISAKSIGDYCKINQQVTIGYANNDDAPTIGNNVKIHAGAKVIGGISIGDNVVIGANAVVVKDVPHNCTVVGVPAYIVRKDDQPMKRSL